MISEGTILYGCFAQPGMKNYPMRMVIESKKNNHIKGYLCWPKLRFSKTSFVGQVQGNLINFTEYELIEGFNIDLPNLYEGRITDDTISGICRHANELGTFSLKKKYSTSRSLRLISRLLRSIQRVRWSV